MKTTWIGHACFLIDADETRIPTDPFAEEVL
jgi:L-ascorbate metabolism protein UlaG (beta-lactamase superfamily)